MDRVQAIKVLKGMLTTHNSDLINYIELLPPNETSNTLSDGYQLHVKGARFHSTKDLEDEVKMYGLIVKEDGGKIIIYKPRS